MRITRCTRHAPLSFHRKIYLYKGTAYAPDRYRKPYDDSANIKQTDMKRTFLDNLTERLTARPTSQRNEVLFFANAHFLFFIFSATTKNTLSFFYQHTNPPQKKNERVFSPTQNSSIEINFSIRTYSKNNYFRHFANSIINS